MSPNREKKIISSMSESESKLFESIQQLHDKVGLLNTKLDSSISTLTALVVSSEQKLEQKIIGSISSLSTQVTVLSGQITACNATTDKIFKRLLPSIGWDRKKSPP
ncbi:MAG: hypothetical protein Sylvanvirus42_4 [Sylvanvirus sp.]|uniref:Uncharacterized protein n=1 Tax=Sylvanvirus sp. TaxID=2487774 RepID=A0A3G5AJ46_9VIRU|nr:MAG: hypothetical protein Sylvanvirus42_4 [Sylvanvirus sp.]